MEDHRTEEAPRPQRRASQTAYEVERSSHQEDRLHHTFCADRAALLFGSYRRDQVANPDTYAQSITLTLVQYPDAVVEWATDPRTGIQSTEKFAGFPPNSGEVKHFCEAEMRRIAQAEQARPSRYRRNDYVPPLRYPGSRANVFVPASNPQFATLLAWSQSPEADECDWRMAEGGSTVGIHVGLHVLQNMGAIRRSAAPSLAVSTEAMRESLMRMAGQERAQEIDAP